MEVKFKNVSYNNILKSINLNFKQGMVTTIIGKNGIGKTQILNLVYGLINPNIGEIFVGDIVLNSNTDHKIIKKLRSNIYYLQESDNCKLFNINILEDIKCRLARNIDEEYLFELLKMFSLNKEILLKNYIEISDGEKKKVFLIIMLLSNKEILILDNPNAGLDNKSLQNLIKLLRKEKKKGKTVIIISQNSEFILKVSDQIAVLTEKGLILGEDKYSLISNEAILADAKVKVPDVIEFENEVLRTKKIKLGYRDSINDLIKDIYRHAK